LDVALRPDGERVAFALDRPSLYDSAYFIVILNKDGSLFNSFRETSSQTFGKIGIGGMIFDSFNYLTLSIDLSVSGSDIYRIGLITRFSVADTVSTITTSFYLKGGALNKLSQAPLL
jgi:hypothetical protein